jgi:hypothetical protein
MCTTAMDGYILPKRESKLGDPLCARLDQSEWDRWNSLMEIIKVRNPLVKPSDIFRDVVFGSYKIVTEEERAYLRTGNLGLLNGAGILNHPVKVSEPANKKKKPASNHG